MQEVNQLQESLQQRQEGARERLKFFVSPNIESAFAVGQEDFLKQDVIKEANKNLEDEKIKGLAAAWENYTASFFSLNPFLKAMTATDYPLNAGILEELTTRYQSLADKDEAQMLGGNENEIPYEEWLLTHLNERYKQFAASNNVETMDSDTERSESFESEAKDKTMRTVTKKTFWKDKESKERGDPPTTTEFTQKYLTKTRDKSATHILTFERIDGELKVRNAVI